ncbi:MAG: hypothetical protein K2N80_13280 [Lachnospiraceae bacterium]|nr:hypothetical protein [Lachnospiraceae bacterium]
MKRSIIAILLAGMMLSVTACGSGSPEAENTVAGVDAEKIREEAEAEMLARHQERTESSEKAAETEERDDETDKNDKASAEERRSRDDEEKEEESGRDDKVSDDEAADDGYVRGKATDTTYESEWIGFRYEIPEGFTMSDEDEMDAILQAGGELLYEDRVDDIVDYARMIMVYEMMAKNRYGDVITIYVEKTNFDIDTYVAAIKMQMGNVDTIDVTMDDGETVEVGGVEFEKYSLLLDYGGVEVKEDYYLRKQGDRMICMLLGYSDDAAAEKIMSGFSPY